METKNHQYVQKKEMAISVLKDLKPTSNDDVINIIETILNCYVEPYVYNEKGIIKVDKQTNQPSEVKFLIDELTSFIEGIKKQRDKLNFSNE